MKNLSVNIVCYDSATDDYVDSIVNKYKLKYARCYNPEEDLYIWEGIKMSEKLYTYLALLDVVWHIEKSAGAVGEL